MTEDYRARSFICGGSKGCPFKCSYCLYPQTLYKGNVTLRKPEKIAEEIRLAVKNHGYKSIYFDDDTFNMGDERISKLCDYMKEIKSLGFGVIRNRTYQLSNCVPFPGTSMYEDFVKKYGLSAADSMQFDSTSRGFDKRLERLYDE